MTGDEQINTYIRRIQDIIQELYNLADEIKANTQGIGQEKCIQSLQNIAESYDNIIDIIVRNYYIK